MWKSSIHLIYNIDFAVVGSMECINHYVGGHVASVDECEGQLTLRCGSEMRRKNDGRFAYAPNPSVIPFCGVASAKAIGVESQRGDAQSAGVGFLAQVIVEFGSRNIGVDDFDSGMIEKQLTRGYMASGTASREGKTQNNY